MNNSNDRMICYIKHEEEFKNIDQIIDKLDSWIDPTSKCKNFESIPFTQDCNAIYFNKKIYTYQKGQNDIETSIHRMKISYKILYRCEWWLLLISSLCMIYVRHRVSSLPDSLEITQLNMHNIILWGEMTVMLFLTVGLLSCLIPPRRISFYDKFFDSSTKFHRIFDDEINNRLKELNKEKMQLTMECENYGNNG